MTGFHDSSNPWFQDRLNRGDLASAAPALATGGHTSPQSARACSVHYLVRDIGNVSFAHKRQHMVFTEAEDIDIPDKYHLVMALIEDGIVDNFFQRLL